MFSMRTNPAKNIQCVVFCTHTLGKNPAQNSVRSGLRLQDKKIK